MRAEATVAIPPSPSLNAGDLRKILVAERFLGFALGRADKASISTEAIAG